MPGVGLEPLRQVLPEAARPLARSAYIAARYGGRRFFCPCCETGFRRLLPYGDPPRPNRRCPSCGSLMRHRLLWLYLCRELQILSASQRVLHIAPERSMHPRLRSLPNLTYVSADLEMPRAAVRAELTRLPFGDASFDVVICSHVLEHVEPDQQAMAELRRVLNHTGRALVMVPVRRGQAATYEDASITDAHARLEAFGHPGHVRHYGADVAARLEAAGFTVDPVDYVDHLAAGEADRITAVKGETIFVCRR